MMADFVSLRGGGLLALGGRLAFAEGGYAGTPVAEALPVEIEPTKAADNFLATLKVRPTRLGQTHVATQVGATEQASAERWASLPALTSVNPIRRVKPGAAVLLTARDGERGEQVVLAYQRYGAGKTIAFPGSGLVAVADARRHPASRTRRTRRSGGGCCGGWWTACRSASRWRSITSASSAATRCR